jgi:hypothetical protein
MAEEKKARKKWIKAAVAGGKGAFKAKAEKAGETTREFASEKEHAAGKLGREARLATTLMDMHHSKSRADRLYKQKTVRRAG